MTLILQLILLLVVVPFLTYWAIGFYVQVRIALGRRFSLWGELMTFSAINLPDSIGKDDVMNHIQDYIDDAK